jgi:hypothetical protein
MMVSAIRRMACVAALACGLSAIPVWQAQAQDTKPLSDAEKKKALEHYEKGKRLFNVGRYAEAIEEYQNVYLITADANMLMNIAQAYRLAEQLTEAQRFYRRYLSVAPPNAEGRGLAQQKLAEVEKLIEERKKAGAPTAPPPAAPPATAPPPAAPPATAPPPAAPPATAPPPAVSAPPAPPPLGPGPLTPVPPATGAPGSAEPPAASVSVTVPPEADRPSRAFPLALVIGGGVLLAGSGGLAMLGQSKEDQLEKDAKAGRRFDPKLQKDGETANLLAVVAGVGGLAATVTGIVLLARSGSPSTPSSETPAPAPQASVAPVLAPGYAGASARVVF